LSFLGLGCSAACALWGVNDRRSARPIHTPAAPHALIFPGIAIALTVLAFNFIGDGLREYSRSPTTSSMTCNCHPSAIFPKLIPFRFDGCARSFDDR
jgi:hypothetical protein